MPHSSRVAAPQRLALAAALAALLCGAASAQQTELVIATVNNGHMIEMQKLSKNFEQAHPDIKLKWVTLEEGVLRQRVTTDIATKGGQFDVMTIGMYEAPIWGKKGWLQELKTEVRKGKNADDGVLARIVNGLADLVPKAVGALAGAFAAPLLQGVAGPVTKIVLEKLKGG